MHLWLYLRRRVSLRRRPLRVRMPVKQSRAYESAGVPGPAAAGLVSYGAMKPTRSPTSEAAELDPEAPEVLRVLVDNHARFLAFLERRVGSRHVAEDILQEAFVRSLDHTGSLRSAESATAWFYRVLRNAITDHFRRQDTQDRALDRLTAETAVGEAATDRDLEAVVCECVLSLVDTLKPEYATALRRVDLDEISVRSYAQEAGITAGNAGVRLHRAREALRKQLARSCGTCLTHGCFDCQCQSDGAQRT
jgi:RNA polymerase sigma factor (sigma-70 family)